MTEPKFTPGPYSRHPMTNASLRACGAADGSPAFAYADVHIGAGDKIIGEVRLNSGGAGYPYIDNVPELEATAALFIAAPDMLALLKESLYHLRLDDGAKGYHVRAEAIIAKAEGREVAA